VHPSLSTMVRHVAYTTKQSLYSIGCTGHLACSSCFFLSDVSPHVSSRSMLLQANSMSDAEVPPILIEVDHGDGWDKVKRDILSSLRWNHGQHGRSSLIGRRSPIKRSSLIVSSSLIVNSSFSGADLPSNTVLPS